MGDCRTPLERAVDRANAPSGQLSQAAEAVRAMGFEIVATPHSDPREALLHMEGIAARILQYADEKLAEARRAQQ